MNQTNRANEAKRVTLVGFFVNVILTAAKLIAGYFGKSSAMIADGVHSLSDFVTDIVVIIFINISGKDKDSDHDYGHGKYETFATMIISFLLFGVGIYILVNGILDIIKIIGGGTLEEPQMIAFYAALISIVSKEILYQYTVRVGRKIDSYAVIANAWHHRSDAFSSVGVAIGILGAILLGGSWRILDPIASVVVSFFIMKVAFDLCLPSVNELLERSLSDEDEAEIERIICDVKDVIGIHNLRTRRIGSSIAIDVHVKMDKNMTFVHSHEVATKVENALRQKYGSATSIYVHTEPL